MININNSVIFVSAMIIVIPSVQAQEEIANNPITETQSEDINEVISQEQPDNNLLQTQSETPEKCQLDGFKDYNLEKLKAKKAIKRISKTGADKSNQLDSSDVSSRKLAEAVGGLGWFNLGPPVFRDLDYYIGWKADEDKYSLFIRSSQSLITKDIEFDINGSPVTMKYVKNTSVVNTDYTNYQVGTTLYTKGSNFIYNVNQYSLSRPDFELIMAMDSDSKVMSKEQITLSSRHGSCHIQLKPIEFSYFEQARERYLKKNKTKKPNTENEE